MSDFDIAGAKKAGYSDAEIADHLAKTRNFDAPAARKAGYSDADILGHLSGPAAAPTDSPGLLSQGVDWLKTRAINAGTSFAGQARGAADLVEGVNQKFGMSPSMAKAALMLNPITAVGQFMPSTNALNQTIYDKGGVSQTNLPGPIGHAIDVGAETALQAPAFPGAIVRNLVPAFVGGAAQELAGRAVEGSPWEVPVRVGTGLVAGGGAAGAQNIGGNVGRGVTNALAANGRNVDTQAAAILGRSLERDKTNFNALATEHAQFPEGTPLVVAAGENTRGAVRGSTAAPGPARTTVADASEGYLTGADKRVGGSINANVSDLPPISTRINALEKEQSAAARPAYQAAGIPDRIQMTETTRPGEPVTRMVPILPGAKGKTKITEPGEPVIERSFNTPNFSTPELDALIKASPDVQTAMNAARRLPEFQHLPNNSMALLDKAYKHLNGMEQEAIRSGNGTRAHDLSHLRTDFKKALVDANPKYGEALDAYAGPAKLIDAAEVGYSWFSKNVHPDQAAREFKAMPPAQQTEALGSAANWLREQAANTDRATAAERIWRNQNIRDRLKAILPEEKYAEFAKLMDQEKQGATVLRGINSGSRTVPMGLEAADNAAGNALSSLVRGRPVSAALGAGNALLGRIGEGRTQAVNDRLAQWMMETDPQKIGMVRSLAERGRLQEARRSGNRVNALAAGAFLPATGSDR